MANFHKDPAPNQCSLLFRPKPVASENLAGYLLRLAELNHLHHTQEFLDFLGQKPESHFQPPLTPQLGVYSLARLSTSLELPVSILAEMSRPIDVRVGKHRKFFYQGLAWPIELLRYRYRAWCPGCLAEQSVHLSCWDWQLTTHCCKHHVLLIDRCPECGKRVSWRRASLSYCSCGFSLATAPTSSINPNDSVIDIPPVSG